MKKPTSTTETTARGGFTLIEINLTLLVIGVGLVALLGLFPVGLRQANLATADTAQSTFADHVFSVLRAEAVSITNWAEWAKFDTEVLKNARIGGQPVAKGAETTIPKYAGVAGNTMRYRLDLASVAEPVDFGGRLWRATIRVMDREQGDLDTSPLYSTDFVFMGPPPP